MLVVAGGVQDAIVADLPQWLNPGDLVVVNDASTLPAALPGAGPGGEPLEWRLASHAGPGLWWAVAFGAGNWRMDTDLRPAPPRLLEGQRAMAAGVAVEIMAISPLSARLVLLRPLVSADAWYDAVYRRGTPVQYSYLADDLALGAVQTAWAGRPWAVEAPSAAFPLTWRVLDGLRQRGVGVVTLTHAAGLSATGDAGLDAALPLPERYEVPEATLAAIAGTKARGGRVLAVGTSVVRALESAARGPRAGTTRLKLGETSELRVVDGLLSNVHGPGESHFELMQAFAPAGLLAQAFDHAIANGYLIHEFGDATLILR